MVRAMLSSVALARLDEFDQIVHRAVIWDGQLELLG